MHLDKIQIKRILKDHCYYQVREGVNNKDLAIDYIAQTIIEHEKEIIIKKSIENKFCAMLDKFLIARSNKKCKRDCK